MKKAVLPAYSATLFLSAFLLFSVQPLLAKMLLPLLGGTPMVWNAAMVFFQTMLLLGYAYAHASARFIPPRVQGFVQLGLLILALTSLPFALGAQHAGGPTPTEDPLFWQIGVMILTAGLPFFAVSASAPMLQHWFAATAHDRSESPYFLYAASNAGSMLALLCYPFVIEPLWDLDAQTGIWAVGYVFLIVLTAGCALFVRGGGKAAEKAETAPAPPDAAQISWGQRAMWLALSFVPSSLMLGVTTTITTDIASAPLLWVVPLALYVGTFILAFAHKQAISYQWTLYLQTFALAAVLCVVVTGLKPGALVLMGLHLALFATTALACHTRLADIRPGARHLTEFYLLLSLGGVLGGIFNALAAPNLFSGPIEYNIALVAAVLLRYPLIPALNPVRFLNGLRRNGKPIAFSDWGFLFAMGLLPAALVFIGWAKHDIKISLFAGLFLVPALLLIHHYRLVFAIVTIVPLALYPGLAKQLLPDILFQERNYFGVLRISDSPEHLRYLVHGTTTHGGQARIPGYEKTPLTYFYPGSSVGEIFGLLERRKGPQKIAGLGLGVGSIACYVKPGRSYTFYEIDPLIIKVAEDPHWFTFLSGCGSPYEIRQGDGRLEIAKTPDGTYDMIFLDVFSSDNIPAHVMTREAVAIYKRKLKPDGILVMNISNRYLDLIRVTAATAGAEGFTALYKLAPGGKIEGTTLWYSPSIFGVFALDGKRIAALEEKGWKTSTPEVGLRPWTDGYVDIVGALKFGNFKF